MSMIRKSVPASVSALKAAAAVEARFAGGGLMRHLTLLRHSTGELFLIDELRLMPDRWF